MDIFEEACQVGLGAGYQYDAAGSLTQDATYNYFWDYENRLTKVKKVSDGSNVADYTYDATMRRIEKIDYTQVPNVTTRFYEDGWSDIEERDGSDTLTATYVNGPGIDEYITMTRGGNDYWYMQSPIVGNVAALVNSSGAIQEGYTYTAYGTATVHTGAGTDATWFTSDDVSDTKSALGNAFTFTGRRLDAETGLMYFRGRMYQPATGAFISRDPAGYVDGMSLYLGYFAPSDTDPTGLTWRPVSLAVSDARGGNNWYWAKDGKESYVGWRPRGATYYRVFGVDMPFSVIQDLVRNNPDAATDRQWWQARAAEYSGRKCLGTGRTGEEYYYGQNGDEFNVGRAFGTGLADGGLYTANGLSDFAVSTVTLGQVSGPDWAQGLVFNSNDPNLRFSRGAGYVAGAALTAAWSLNQAGINPRVWGSEEIQVTRWGRPGLESGDWVMKGEKTYSNYVRSFKWKPTPWNRVASFESGESFSVPANQVFYPRGISFWKGVFGQRMYFP